MPRGVLAWVTVVAAIAMALGTGAPAHASFPGQNGRIAFNQDFSIRTINPDGTGEQVFLADPPRRVHGSWSPDGKQVVYLTGVGGPPPELAVVNADGTNDHLITNNGFREMDPRWSADGTKITFWAEPVPTGQFDFHIFVVDAAGGTPTQLTNTGINRYPVWSPDGTKIMWQGTGGLTEIWTMNPDGSGKVNLTNTPEVAENNPDWSPDGTRIAFRGGDFSGDVDDLRVMNADGSNPVVIADPPSGFPVSGVHWSPDGTKIAYNAGADLYVVNPDGTNNTLDPACLGRIGADQRLDPDSCQRLSAPPRRDADARVARSGVLPMHEPKPRARSAARQRFVQPAGAAVRRNYCRHSGFERRGVECAGRRCGTRPW